jgi:hypothetical protein
MRPTLVTAAVLFGALSMTACSEDTPGDSLETSVQAVSVSPTSVYPTPSTDPSATPSSSASDEADPVSDWCEELVETGDDDEEAIEVYREGRSLPDPTIAKAAGILASGEGSEQQVIRAGELIERSCGELGVDLAG